MGRKKVLEKRLARLQAKKTQLAQRALASQDANEVRSINEQLQEIGEDIVEVQEEIEAIDTEDHIDNPVQSEPADPDVLRNGIPQNAQLRGINPVAAFTQSTVGTARTNEEPYSSMEYRNAFMQYVQRGTPIPVDVVQRAGGDTGTTIAADLGMIIPNTIMDVFIKDVSKVYGQVYSKVRKLNIKGGVKFPINKLKANFKWITETTPSQKQKAGEIKESVLFEYNIGEIRVAETLLAQVVSLPLFEQEIVKIMVEAYVEAMDKGIIAGTGSGQLLGITKDPRVKNKAEFTVDEFSNWEMWRKNLFAKIPLSKRGKGEFLFTAATVEANLLTMKDANNNPIFKEATDLATSESTVAAKFYGREVTLVEPDVLADFDTANTGDVVGVYWIPQDYAINTNLQFGMKRYYDEDNNEWINKGLTIVDGKILDPSGCYLIKKK